MTTPAARADALKDWVLLTELWRERLLERSYQARAVALRAAGREHVERALAWLDAANRLVDVAEWYRRRIWRAIREVSRLECAERSRVSS